MDINALIDKYFDGETTVAEERLLREMLADPSYDNDAADETRATMAAIDAMASKAQHSPNTQKQSLRESKLLPTLRRPSAAFWSHLARAAAVAAVIIVGAIAIFKPAPDCVAYAYGHRVDSPELALQFMMSDLEAVGAAQDAVQSQIAADFSAIANALDNE